MKLFFAHATLYVVFMLTAYRALPGAWSDEGAHSSALFTWCIFGALFSALAAVWYLMKHLEKA